tara:strand:+ start:4820 stop:5530 length:711 start_codon:yes stop_codon:yes gene_type:complete
MKKTFMLKYIISTIFFIFFNTFHYSQIELSDSTEVKSIYGLKIGIDLSKQIRMLTESNYKGLVINTDYKLFDKFFIASEFGQEKKYTKNEILDFETKGSFFKIGGNYNLYKNRPGLNNEIYIGFRFGIGKFNHKLNSFKIYNLDNYWDQKTVNNITEFKNLTANWFELVLGFNAEIKRNVFMGLSLRLNRLLKNTKPENFNNLYIPGFNKVTENNNFGVGITYSINYQIPFFKKNN